MRVSPASSKLESKTNSAASIQQLYEFLLQKIVQQFALLEVQLVCWDSKQLAEQIFCYSTGEVITRSQHREAIQNYLGSRQSLGETIVESELQPLSLMAYKTSNLQCCEVYISIVGKTEEHLDYLVLIAPQEMTDAEREIAVKQIQMFQVLVDLNREIQERSSKNQFLETMLQFSQHQLHNPLALIRLHAETLFLSLSAPEQRKQADCIRQASDCLSEQISNLFSYSQENPIQRSVCDLKTIFDSAQALLEPKLEQKNIEIRYLGQSIKLVSDRWQLEQVFENLLDNAIFFSPNGGKIQVDWHMFQHEILITIADQGPGIEASDQGQLFDSRYSRRQGGMGLGLAIAKKIILAHRGNIWAENLPDSGALFSIVLPR